VKDEEVDSEIYNNDNGFHHCCLQGEREGERETELLTNNQ
jgi:hypothetical protein